MSVKLLYFAWVREKAGKSEEVVDLPPGVVTISDLIAWLKTRGPEYEEAFARANVIRVAIDRMHTSTEADIHGAKEIAFFPPVTGG